MESKNRKRNFLEDKIFNKILDYLKEQDKDYPDYVSNQFRRVAIAYSAAELFDMPTTTLIREQDRDTNVPKPLRKLAVDALVDLGLLEVVKYKKQTGYYVRQ